MSTNCNLLSKKCNPCRGDIPPLKGQALSELYLYLSQQWKIVDDHHLERKYTFKDFKAALAFTNRLGEIAEREGHHPDIFLTYGKVKVMLWTHKIDGLSENDFILAAKYDQVT